MSGKIDTYRYISTKERIDMAALQLFAERGFKGTTIKDIAKIVGVTEGAIYRHYKSKDEIVESLIDRVINDLSGKLEESILRKRSVNGRIKSAVNTLIRYAFEKPDCFRYLNMYHLFKKDYRDKQRKFPGRILISLFKRAYIEKGISVKPEIALCITVGTIERMFVIREIGLIAGREEEVISEVETAILRAIGINPCVDSSVI